MRVVDKLEKKKSQTWRRMEFYTRPSTAVQYREKYIYITRVGT